MWLILGFRDSIHDGPPEPFFVGIFQDYKGALENCTHLNIERKNKSFYEVKEVQPNMVYDYEWNVMEEDDYYHMKKM